MGGSCLCARTRSIEALGGIQGCTAAEPLCGSDLNGRGGQLDAWGGHGAGKSFPAGLLANF